MQETNMKKTTIQKKAINIKPVGKTLSWQAPDFVYYKKTRNWFIIISVIAIILLILFYFMKQYTGMAVVAVAVLAIFSGVKKKPNMIKYVLSDKGITYKNKTYEFENLKSFYMIIEMGIPKLYLEQTGVFKPALLIIIGKINPQIIRSFLLSKLPENPELKQTTYNIISGIIGG